MPQRKPLPVADEVAKTPASNPLASPPTEYADRLRAAMASPAALKRARGRPLAKDSTVGGLSDGNIAIVLEVLERQRHLGGSLRKATGEVAAARGKSLDSVKKLVQRHPWLRGVDDTLSQIERRARDEAELLRRMLGMPDDVRRKFGPLDAMSVLDFLRRENIDGTCPSWLVEAARR